MPGFRRVFNAFPGFNVLGNIESVNIIDIPPPATPLGAGSGVCGIIGEFENGLFNAPTRVFGGTDLETKFGGFGFTKDGIPYSGPTSRLSGEATQFWEGNGFLALRNKRFAGLIVTRVDNSSGFVAFERLACKVGTLSAPFNLEPGDTLEISVDGGPAATATWDAAAAVRPGAGFVSPTGFLGGETLELSIDGGPTRVIVFTVAEQTVAQVSAYINSQMAAQVSSVNGAELDLNGIVRGTAGSVEVIGGTALATIGQTVGTSTGTGDVANIDSVSQAEVAAVIEADIANTSVDTTIRDSLLRICATATPVTGTIQVTGGTGLVGLGLTVDADPISASTGTPQATIPSGTRLLDTVNNVQWVTMEPVVFEAGTGGPFQARVRPWIDDDTAPTAAANTVTEIVDNLEDVFTVDNALDLNRISGAALDAAYLDAFNSTLDINSTPFDINLQYAARHTSNIIRFGLENALTATAAGHRARKWITAPPIDTTIEDASANTGVGVGTLRNQRGFYLFPGLTTFIPEIARLGTEGGPGFTADGVIQLPSDGFYASVRSLLPPEENAGQRLSDTNVGPIPALSLEAAYDPEQGGIGLGIDVYIAFKNLGIIGPRADRQTGISWQSDITSVDPNTDPALADAKRRFMGDFIIDSLFDIAAAFVKKLNTPARRRALTGQINAFLNLLKSENQPDFARIEDFIVQDDTSPEQRALGFQLYSIKVRLFSSLDFIVITTEIGTTVVIEEIA